VIGATAIRKKSKRKIAINDTGRMLVIGGKRLFGAGDRHSAKSSAADRLSEKSAKQPQKGIPLFKQQGEGWKP
jgi:hypothetical protein